MIELVVRELKHEIEAYQDFRDYRDRVRLERGDNADISREGWLSDRREALQSRMRRRRKGIPRILKLGRSGLLTASRTSPWR